MNKKMNPEELRFLVTIVNRGISKRVVKELALQGYNKYQIILGRGTAPSEILSVLGLDVIEKDVVLCVVKKNDVEEIYNAFNTHLKFQKPGHGISCSIPVSSVASLDAYQDLLA